jgi:hypothetical protein
MPQRYFAMVVRAEPRCSFRVRRDDDGSFVTLSRHEANRTNYRLDLGDKIELSIYRSAGRQHGFDVVLLNVDRHREPIRKPPPYYALGPVLRVGIVPRWAR